MEIIRPEQRAQLSLTFASGAAYDCLISLFVLNRAEKYELSPAWAKSVRGRLSPESRRTLRFFFGTDEAPGPGLLHLVPEIGAPFGTENLVRYVRDMSPGRFVGELLTRGRPGRAPVARALEDLACGRPLPAALDAPLAEFLSTLSVSARRRARRLVDEAEAQHRAYVALVAEYAHLHFDDEWEQTSRVIAARLRQDQALLGRLQAPEVIARVTGGVTVAPENRQRVILVPTYYVTPFVWIINRSDDVLLLYGARPAADAAEIQALTIDPTLATRLKALADDSRLRMLRLLAHEPMYGQQLAQRLGLSHATVSHHMGMLRAAGLTRTELAGGSKRYSLRREGVEHLFAELLDLLRDDGEEHRHDDTHRTAAD